MPSNHAAAPVLIAIVGGSGAGKTTFAKHLHALLGEDRCTIVSEDNYYRSDAASNGDFDELRDFDNAILQRHLLRLKSGEEIQEPRYDFAGRKRAKAHERVPAMPYIIVEGLYLLADARLRDLFDYRIYIDVDPDVRLARRILRDNVWEKRIGGEPLEGQITYYLEHVKPKYDRLILPARKHADLLVTNNGSMADALREFEHHIRHSWLCKERSCPVTERAPSLFAAAQ